MSVPERVTEAQRWLRYAHEDLIAGEVIQREPQFRPRHSCWLAQQAVEKAIKAALIFTQTDFPRRHDLDALRSLLPTDWQVKTLSPDLAELTEWAVEARYPGDRAEASAEDAHRALTQAREIVTLMDRDFAVRDLKIT